jgi:hypothetical protein
VPDTFVVIREQEDGGSNPPAPTTARTECSEQRCPTTENSAVESDARVVTVKISEGPEPWSRATSIRTGQ